MKRATLIGALALAAVVLLAAPPVSWNPSTTQAAEETKIKTDDELVAAIQANTPEKHREIAAWYKAKAADERKQAEDHQKMSHAYRGSKAAYAEQMHTHCDALVALHQKTAAQYEKLAKEHEAAAAAMAAGGTRK